MTRNGTKAQASVSFAPDEYGFVDLASAPRRALAPTPEAPEFYAKALEPFQQGRPGELPNVIDARILALMNAAEDAIAAAGDIADAFDAEIALGFGSIAVAHQDVGVQREYERWFDALDVAYWVKNAIYVTSIYGNSYTVAIGSGSDFAITSLNPKRVAVGRSFHTHVPVWFGEPQLLFHKAELPDFNEWQDVIDGGGMPLDPKAVFHMHTVKPHFKRYGIPRVIAAWSDITTRLVLEEMIRGTIEGVQNQIRLWRIKNPGQGEVARLRNELRANRHSRTHDLAWDDRLSVEVIVPGVVDSLLAQDTWVGLTASIFRKLGMSLRVVSSVVGMGEDSDRGQEIEVMVHLSRLHQRVRDPGLSLARRIALWISEYADQSLKKYGLPDVRVHDTAFAVNQSVRNVFVPLLNFGVISAQTVHEGIGLDHATEISRLERELELRAQGIISPYAGFAQSGPSGTAVHRQSQGKPVGQADTEEQDALERPT